MKLKSVTVNEVEYLAHLLAKKHMEWGEPIPEFKTRYGGILESCLQQPFQTFSGQLYKGMIPKGAALFYLMIKNHPFQNGNKRIAVTTLLLFLYKNKYWVKLTNHELYAFAKWVAESDPNAREGVLISIQSMLKFHIVKVDVIEKMK